MKIKNKYRELSNKENKKRASGRNRYSIMPEEDKHRLKEHQKTIENQ